MSTSSGTPKSSGPIMVRANITQDEWTELRAVALRETASTSELVARALRQVYPAITATEKDGASDA